MNNTCNKFYVTLRTSAHEISVEGTKIRLGETAWDIIDELCMQVSTVAACGNFQGFWHLKTF